MFFFLTWKKIICKTVHNVCVRVSTFDKDIFGTTNYWIAVHFVVLALYPFSKILIKFLFYSFILWMWFVTYRMYDFAEAATIFLNRISTMVESDTQLNIKHKKAFIAFVVSIVSMKILKFNKKMCVYVYGYLPSQRSSSSSHRKVV